MQSDLVHFFFHSAMKNKVIVGRATKIKEKGGLQNIKVGETPMNKNKNMKSSRNFS